MLMKIIALIQKRPSDRFILLSRVIFWLLYTGTMYYNLFILDGKDIDTSYLFWAFQFEAGSQELEIIKYVMTFIWVIPIIMWITNWCILKKKYMRILQICFWILIFYISASIQESPTLDFDIIIGLMWIFPLFAWITGKCITSKCMRYKEKIIKIRV